MTTTMTTTAPASPAADAHEPRALARAEWRRRLWHHAFAVSGVASVVVVILAGVSLYLAEHGTSDCESADGVEVCVARAWWPLTLQVRSETWTEDGVAHGPRIEWHRNGKLWVSGEYAHGQRTGRWSEGWESGQPRFEGHYEHDLLVGDETWFYDDGSVEWTTHRVAGKRDGTERWYWENGQLRREGSWKAGEKDGVFTSYNADGATVTVTRFVDGVAR